MATIWFIERDNAFTANRRENGVVRPDWSQVLGQLIGTSGDASSGDGENGADRKNLCEYRQHGEVSFEFRLLKTILSLGEL